MLSNAFPLRSIGHGPLRLVERLAGQAGGGVRCFCPTLEQTALNNSLNLGTSVLDGRIPAIQLIGQTRLPGFRCPSDSGEPLNTNRANLATSNCMAVFGSLNEQGTAAAGGLVYGSQVGVATEIFSANSRTRFGDISDGTSNTIMIGEMCYGPNGV